MCHELWVQWSLMSPLLWFPVYAIDEFINRSKSIPINRLIMEIDKQSIRQDSVTPHRFSSINERKWQSNQ